MPVYVENQPTADVLMTSMRSMGYTFESAVADIIDNSIAASATKIELKYPVTPTELFVAICDNGTGMTRDELYNAMKYGSRHHDEQRSEKDLGRFGLGLKSASLSQCRKLTVISKKDQTVSSFVWSLDYVEQEKSWMMAEYSHEETEDVRFSDYLDDKDSGTVVLWEDFDLMKKSSGKVYAELASLQSSTADYIALIYHRFLSKDRNGLEIYSNNYRIEPLDPFLEKHPKTDIRRRISLPVMDNNGIERMVYVQPYVLPFQKDLSPADKKLSGGIENYRSKQGFYIYRNERLIIWGRWFGRARDELTKYARVKVDIPNTLDDIWGIDIKKQSAKIPGVIKSQLTKAVDEAMDISVRKQKHKGRRTKPDENIDYIWDRIEGRNNSYTYKINRESRIFDLIKGKVSEEVWAQIDMVLEEIEEAVPYQQIYIDKSQDKVEDTVSDERLAEIESKAEMLVKLAVSMGDTDTETAIQGLMKSEPFNRYPELEEILRKEML